MLGTALILFREALEAALIVRIMAACEGIAGRDFWVACGLVAGILGAGLVAAGMASHGARGRRCCSTAPPSPSSALMRGSGNDRSPRRGGAGPSLSCLAGAVLAIGLGAAATASPAQAEFKLRYPFVDYREIEFEHNGDTTFDRSKSGKNNNQSYTHEIEVGATPFWLFGLEAETGAASGENLRYEATTFENIFQLTPQGKYWADLGFFAEYSHAASRRDADSFTFGPLIQKELSDVMGTDTVHTLNLLFSKEVGRNRTDDTPFFYAWQSRLRLDPHFEPGIEIYGQIDDIAAPGKLADQRHRAGPVVAGLHSLAPYGKIKYEVGYLFGLTHATEDGAVRWRLEYEIPF